MKIELTDVKDDGEGHWVIGRVITLDDGTKHEGVYVLPHDILEWRAAEYDIDPEDTETLLDMVLAEHHLELSDPVPVLFTANTVSEAREQHLNNCAQAKLRTRMSTRGKDHVLNVVRERSLRNPEVVEVKRQIARYVREQHKMISAMSRGNSTQTETARLTKLREHASQIKRGRSQDAQLD